MSQEKIEKNCYNCKNFDFCALSTKYILPKICCDFWKKINIIDKLLNLFK